MPLTKDRQDLLDRLRVRYGPDVVPRVDPDKLPEGFWERASTHLDDEPEEEPLWRRVLGTAYDLSLIHISEPTRPY